MSQQHEDDTDVHFDISLQDTETQEEVNPPNNQVT